MIFLICIAGVILAGIIAHFISYILLKHWTLKSGKWDLNICCGRTDGGGINADILQHRKVNNFVLVEDIYNLPFKDKQFKRVLCSHTMEHVEDPDGFFSELSRVGEEVVVVIPPLYDFFAVLTFWEHKWIFLSFRKVHKTLPPKLRFRLGWWYQQKYGQINNA